MKLAQLPHGFLYYKVLDAAEALKARGLCGHGEMNSLAAWLQRLPKPDPSISTRIAKFAV
jgi:hypothetical protein